MADQELGIFILSLLEVKISTFFCASQVLLFELLQLDMDIFYSIYYGSIKAFHNIKDISNVPLEGKSFFSYSFNPVCLNKVICWHVHLHSI